MAQSDVNRDEKCTVVWEVDRARSYTITGPGLPATGKNTKLPTGSEKMAPATELLQYTITYTNNAGTASKSAVCRLNPATQER